METLFIWKTRDISFDTSVLVLKFLKLEYVTSDLVQAENLG
jgi:hypothetical protein